MKGGGDQGYGDILYVCEVSFAVFMQSCMCVGITLILLDSAVWEYLYMETDEHTGAYQAGSIRAT